MQNYNALVKQAKREKLRIIFNPEVPPEPMLGDIGYVVPPLEDLDDGMMAWRWRLVKALGIVGAFALVIAVFSLSLWYLGALGFWR